MMIFSLILQRNLWKCLILSKGNDNKNYCDYHSFRLNYDRSEIADFFSLIEAIYPSSGKNLHCFEALFYFSAEDFSVIMTNVA